MAALKTAKEMDRIRQAQGILNEKAVKAFIPEKVEYRDEIAIIVSRVNRGPQGWMGLFKVSQVPIDDKTRLTLFKLPRKQIKEGIAYEFVSGEIDRALARKCFR